LAKIAIKNSLKVKEFFKLISLIKQVTDLQIRELNGVYKEKNKEIEDSTEDFENFLTALKKDLL
jgi:hypothetical protein